MKSERNYYVYALLREDGTPFYVGKGKGRRWSRHEVEVTNGRTTKNAEKDAIIIEIVNRGGHVQKVKLEDQLTDVEALEAEIHHIRLIGRRPHGPLTNKTDGGEGTAARFVPEQTRSRMSEAAKKRGISPATMAKMLASKTRGRYGPHSAETKLKIRLSKLGRARSAATIEKMRAAATVQANAPGAREAFLKRISRQSVIAKRTQTLKKRCASSDVRKQLSEQAKIQWQKPGARERIIEAQRRGREKTHG